MPDKTYAKVVLNGTTYVDLTSDTVDSSTLLSGYTAHNRSGELITGSFDSSIFVLKAGDTMTGYLTLNGNPTSNLHAVTKQYVDNRFIKNTGEDYMHGSYVITDSDSLLEGTELVTLNKNYILLEENSPESHSESPYTKIHKSYIQVKKAFYDDGFLDESYGTEITYDGIKIEDSVHNLPSYKSVLNNNALHIYTDGTNLASEISDSTLKINGHNLLRMTPHFAQMFATQITANKNLQTTEFLKVGQYYCDSSSTVASLTNCPVTTAFTMTVEAPIQTTYDDESLTTASYRLRTIKTCIGEVFSQYVARSNGGTYTYYTWQPGSIGVSKDTYSNTSMKSGDLIARRNGNVVNIVSSGNAVSVAAGNWRNYVTIAEKYRPSEETYAVVTNAYGEVKTARIRTNGNVDLYTGTSITSASNFAFTATYIVD